MKTFLSWLFILLVWALPANTQRRCRPYPPGLREAEKRTPVVEPPVTLQRRDADPVANFLVSRTLRRARPRPEHLSDR